MAIDRTLKWRCQWQGKNGWANMLEIIPAGTTLSGTDLTVTSFSRSAFEMDFAEFGFEDLPIGVGKFPAASFSFVWNNLPSGLQELLKEPYYATTETTTLFTYYNDEGTSTLILQYIGAQANTLGNKFEIKGSAVVGNVVIETFDLLKTILDTCNTNQSVLFGVDVNDDTVATPSDATVSLTGGTDLEIVDFSDDTDFKIDYPVSFQQTFLLYSIADFRDAFGLFLQYQLVYWTRSGLTPYWATVTQTGYPTDSLTFYKQTRTDAHTKGVALDETEVLILGHVCDVDGITSLGGFFSRDKDGVAEFDSMSTFLTALCESFICKFQARPVTVVNGTSGDTLLTYDIYWLRPFDNITGAVTLEPKITTDSYDIETAAKVFLIAESEIPNMGGDDVNQSRVSVTVSDRTDTWGTKMVLHNLPTLRSNLKGTTINADPRNKYTLKINPRKLLYRDASMPYSTLKVHESVVIADGVNTHTLDSPTSFGTDNWYDNILDGWVTETQNTQGLPQAIAEYITTHWSARGQALREFPCKMVTGELTPYRIGDVDSLPVISAIGVGATSIFLSGKPDWDNGVLDCKFLSLP